MAKKLSNLDAFIKEIKKNLNEYGVRLKMRRTEFLSCGALGFFSEDETGPMIEIARNHPQWKLTLIHEYNHFCQYKENTRLARQWASEREEIFAVEDWLADIKQPSSRELKFCLSLIIRMEHDCEKRTIHDLVGKELVSKKEIRRYIKEANTALVNYAVMRTGILNKLRYKHYYFSAPNTVYKKMRSNKLYDLVDLLNADTTFHQIINKHYKRLTVK